MDKLVLYQPLPIFESKRTDCEERWNAIKRYLPDGNKKSMVELCCSNGYFMFQWMLMGGARARGCDTNLNCNSLINSIGKLAELDIRSDTKLPDERFDIGIFLDTFGASGTEEYLNYMSSYANLCFISGVINKDDFLAKLQKIFKEVEPIYKGFQDRIIYRCKGKS